MTSHAAIAAMLADLGPYVAYPVTPPLEEAVADRLAASATAAPPGRSWWRVATVAAAIVVVLAAALPMARQAVADLLGIGPVRISQVADLSPAATVRDLGQLTTVEAAAGAVSFELLGIDGVEPDAVFLDTTVPGGMVTLAYGSAADGWRLLVTQLDGAVDEDLVGKEVGPETAVEAVTVAGAPGLWIEGAPHTVVVLDADGFPRHDQARLAGNTLVTTRHGVVVRIEADTKLAEAVRIAERLVPLDR